MKPVTNRMFVQGFGVMLLAVLALCALTVVAFDDNTTGGDASLTQDSGAPGSALPIAENDTTNVIAVEDEIQTIPVVAMLNPDFITAEEPVADTNGLALPEDASVQASDLEATPPTTPPIVDVEAVLEEYKGKLTPQTFKTLRFDAPNQEHALLIKYESAFDTSKLAGFSGERRLDSLRIGIFYARTDELVTLLTDENVEFIEIDQNVRVLGDIIPFGVNATLAPTVWSQTGGSGVKVAIVDTGIAEHADLLIAGGTSVVSSAYDDTHGHGTAVAGVVAAVQDDAGIIGVSPDVDLYAVKVMNASSGQLSDVIAGVDWAISNNMDIIVMSFGLESYSPLFRDVLTTAYDDGILLIASSGNADTGTVLYPAAYANVIAVGAVDQENQRAAFSSYGLDQELMAPGTSINTTGLNGNYVVVDGTSFAAPHVAGVAALVKANNLSLTNVQLRGKLRNDALDLGREDRDDEHGYGLVQVNLTSTNYSLGDDSYFYEVFNISDYGLSTETSTFWLSDTGSIDDVSWSAGYFLLRVPPYADRKIHVGEDDTVTVLIIQSKIIRDDNWTGTDSNATDGTVWNDSRYIRMKVDTTDQVGECWDYDTNTSAYNQCFFKNSSIKSQCQLECSNHGISTSSPNCTVGTMGAYRTILNGTNPIMKKTARYDGLNICGSPNNEVDANYQVVNQRRFQCLADGNYTWQGRYGAGSLDWVSFGGSIDCDGADTRRCDPDVYQQACNGIDCGLPTLCRTIDGSACGQDADCFTNHYCVNNTCQTSQPACTASNGEINILTEDYTGNPVNGLSVYLNGVFNTTTSALGAAQIKIASSVSCSANQEIKVTCSDNTTICGIQNTRISLNGDVDSLSYDCTKCSTSNDLYMSQAHVFVDFSDKNVTVTVFSTGISDTIDVNISRQDESGLIQESKKSTITIAAGGQKNASVVFSSLDEDDFLHIWLDQNDDAPAEDNTNNYLLRPAIKPIRAYIDVRVDPSFSSLNEVLTEYLEAFVTRVDDPNTADIHIKVGRLAADDPLLAELKGAPTSLTKPYTAIVISKPVFFEGSPTGQIEILAYGRGIEGTIAAVKRIVNARNTYFVYGPPSKRVYIDDYDTLGIGIYDQLHNSDARTYFTQNNAQLQQKVRNILFDNNFEITVKPVKTLSTTSYSQQTVLRVKNLNSDFSEDYLAVVGVSSTPVVFSGGIYSNLEEWEYTDVPFTNLRRHDGLAHQMASEGWEVWTIEMTGGPQTDNCGTPEGNCTNYTYQDLVDHYWPTSVAGIVEYSGKTQVDYVGHSNGCRSALSSLNSYSSTGKNNAGYYFDFTTGTYQNSDLPTNVVRRFVGVACPAMLNDPTGASEAPRELVGGVARGDSAIQNLRQNNLKNIYKEEYATRVIPFWGGFATSDNRISTELQDYYNDLMIATDSVFNISEVNVTSAYIVAGHNESYPTFTRFDDDGAVPVADPQFIAENLDNATLEIFEANHGNLLKNPNVQEHIKEALR